MNLADSIAHVRLLAATDEDPKLTTPEIEQILIGVRVPDAAGNLPTNTTAAAAWAASTAYVAGQVIKQNPTVGRYWRCKVAGTSAATQPTWPTLTALRATGTVVVDDGVVWEDAGGEWAPTWDLNRALATAWRAKAAKASCRVNVEIQGERINRREVVVGCLEQARIYDRRRAAALSLTGDRFDQQ